MKNPLLFIVFVLCLFSCKKEGQYNPDKNITNAHWYELDERSADTLFSVFIPNAFSPNGDGMNDYFSPKGNYYLTYFGIYNRSSRLIFETTLGSHVSWNGTNFNSKEIVQAGEYTYQLKITDINGNAHKYLGSLWLYR